MLVAGRCPPTVRHSVSGLGIGGRCFCLMSRQPTSGINCSQSRKERPGAAGRRHAAAAGGTRRGFPGFLPGHAEPRKGAGAPPGGKGTSPPPETIETSRGCRRGKRRRGGAGRRIFRPSLPCRRPPAVAYVNVLLRIAEPLGGRRQGRQHWPAKSRDEQQRTAEVARHRGLALPGAALPFLLGAALFWASRGPAGPFQPAVFPVKSLT